MPLLKKGAAVAGYGGGLLDGTDPHCCCSQYCCDGELQCRNAEESFLAKDPCWPEDVFSFYNTFVSWVWGRNNDGTCNFRWDFTPPSLFLARVTGAYDGITECSQAEGAYTWTADALVQPDIPKPPDERRFNVVLPPEDLCDWENAVVTVAKSGRGYAISVSGVVNSRFGDICTRCNTMNGTYVVECGDDRFDTPEPPLELE